MTSNHPGSADHSAIRPAAGLVLAGVVLSVAAGLLHPDQQPANDHPAVFAEYAASTDWTAVHLGQFVGMAVFIAGLAALYPALGLRPGGLRWLGRFGLVAAGAALALYGVLQAVDGVALKQAVDAWAAAPAAQKPLRFTAAETVRWLEWGVRSYQSFLLGLALVLLGAAAAGGRRIPPGVGLLMGLSGVAWQAQGWIIGAQGFAPANQLPTLAGLVLTIGWSLWLLGAALQRPRPLRPRGPSAGSSGKGP
ncbi:hypothetical protein LVY72_17940 [Arthrobacter sp. I2-34]|uniref:DUF4386 domain-containing protein n=1 Tax=Arthrobacter hankyongi TaxID=2904801 RepID=A0ABS9LAS0_9MICC|nr:hypothetical protein [Arthrobacter hankyongi]MCG2623779.1 hypothetical protein [Arthrobacter hankyongi]